MVSSSSRSPQLEHHAGDVPGRRTGGSCARRRAPLCFHRRTNVAPCCQLGKPEGSMQKRQYAERLQAETIHLAKRSTT
jgi:hypothetical protein